MEASQAIAPSGTWLVTRDSAVDPSSHAARDQSVRTLKLLMAVQDAQSRIKQTSKSLIALTQHVNSSPEALLVDGVTESK